MNHQKGLEVICVRTQKNEFRENLKSYENSANDLKCYRHIRTRLFFIIIQVLPKKMPLPAAAASALSCSVPQVALLHIRIPQAAIVSWLPPNRSK